MSWFVAARVASYVASSMASSMAFSVAIRELFEWFGLWLHL